MKPIAFLRSNSVDEVIERTGFWDEYSVLKASFAAQNGAELIAVDWRDSSIKWEDFEFVIPKCAWDYFNHYSEFLAWLDRLERLGVPLRNSIKTVRWNSDKHYLVEMLEQGAPVAPLKLISSDSEFKTIAQELSRHQKILLKPAVSGGAKKTLVYTPNDLEKCLQDAREILRECPVIVQPFIEGISAGEWSFFFFGDTFSHAILKLPKEGDFRAHKLFGAQNIAKNPTQAQIDEAKAILQYVPEKPHYARVDGVYVDDKLLLIELELIEPYLYLECAPPESVGLLTQGLLAT